MNVSELRCACLDASWRARWMAGENPGTFDYPPSGTPTVCGTKFHALARNLTRELRQDATADQDDADALLGRLYSLGGGGLEQLLADGKVDSAAHLTTAFHAFAARPIQLRDGNGARRSFGQIFLAEECSLVDVPLPTRVGNLFVSGAIDCVRLHSTGEIEVVDYKLSTGTELAKELVRVALYRRLLLARDPGLSVRGVLEYFLPNLMDTQQLPDREILELARRTVRPVGRGRG